MTGRHENKKLKQGYARVIGCDEVGRGSLAGPVVAAAVILNTEKQLSWFHEVRDSKLLTAEKRQELDEKIRAQALAFAIAGVGEKVIDKINIHNASLLAMKKAVRGLVSAFTLTSTFLFLDGKFKIPELNIEQEAVVGGDNKILSIAAASIIAKVYRDELMQKFDKQYPKYNLARHKGYATEHHRKMIIQNGLSPIHRLSFCQNLAVL